MNKSLVLALLIVPISVLEAKPTRHAEKRKRAEQLVADIKEMCQELMEEFQGVFDVLKISNEVDQYKAMRTLILKKNKQWARQVGTFGKISTFLFGVNDYERNHVDNFLSHIKRQIKSLKKSKHQLHAYDYPFISEVKPLITKTKRSLEDLCDAIIELDI